MSARSHATRAIGAAAAALAVVAPAAACGAEESPSELDLFPPDRQEYGYFASVWANGAPVERYAGGWEFNLVIDPQRAAETVAALVIWPGGRVTRLDPDFRPGLHPLGSVFGKGTANSRFVKYGTGLGWPEVGVYRVIATRADGSEVLMLVDYRGELLDEPQNIALEWRADGVLRVAFMLPEAARSWGITLADADGTPLSRGRQAAREDGRRVTVDIVDVADWSGIWGVSIALTNEQNIVGAGRPLPPAGPPGRGGGP